MLMLAPKVLSSTAHSIISWSMFQSAILFGDAPPQRSCPNSRVTRRSAARALRGFFRTVWLGVPNKDIIAYKSVKKISDAIRKYVNTITVENATASVGNACMAGLGAY